METYNIVAISDLEAPQNSWTEGEQYIATETETKFQLTSNEAQVAYVIELKEDIMKNFRVI